MSAETSLTDDQRERHVCCMKRDLCTDEHYHECDVVKMLAAERERVAETIDGLALTMVSTADDEGTALTAAILRRAAQIARELA